MEVLFSDIVGMRVVADEVQPLSTVKNLVIDPENGKILAYVVDAFRNKIICPIDVVEWKSAVLRVHDADAIIDGNEVMRVEKVQNDGIQILGSKVETEEGMLLGRVYDYSVDNASESLKNLYVAKGLLILFRCEKKIISWQNILEILPGRIVVKSGLVTIEEGAALREQGAA